MSDTAAEPTPELVEISPQITAVVKGAVPVAELAGFFDRSFGAQLAGGRRRLTAPEA